MRFRVIAPLYLGAVLCAGKAVAQPSESPPAPTWKVPAGCPDIDFVQVRVATLLARPDFVLANTNLAIAGEIVSTDGKYLLTLDLAGGEGHRERAFEAADCQQLGEAAAIVIAITIDPNLTIDEKPPGVPWCETAPPPPLVPPPVAPPTTSQPSNPKSPSWELATEPTVGYGAIPAPALGARLELGRRLKSLRLRMGGGYETSRLLEEGGRGGTFALLEGRLTVGYAILRRRSHFGVGVALEAGILRALGLGVEHPRQVRELWLAPALYLEWTLGLAGGSEIGVTTEAFVPLGRPDFQLDSSTVFRPAPMGGRAALVVRLGIL